MIIDNNNDDDDDYDNNDGIDRVSKLQRRSSYLVNDIDMTLTVKSIFSNSIDPNLYHYWWPNLRWKVH